MSQHEVRALFQDLQICMEAQDRRRAATVYARLASLCMTKKNWGRAAWLLSRAEKCLPQSTKLLLAQAICQFERKNEREARHKIQELAKLVLRKKRLEEYWLVIERELKPYSQLRQYFYETVSSIERNSAIPFLGLAQLYRRRGDADGAIRQLATALRTRDREAKVLAELESILDDQGLKSLGVQLERYRQGDLSNDDLYLLLTSSPSRETEAEASGEMELGQMIEKLEEELGESEPPPNIDQVGPLLAEFRARAHPIIGQDSKSRIALALAFFEMKLFSASRDELKQIEEEDPNFGESLCLLGQIHWEEGTFLAALDVYQKCLRIDRYRGTRIGDEAEYQLARIYLKLQDYGKAMIHLRELEKRAPDYRDTKRVKEQLAKHLGVDALPGKRTSQGKKLRKTG